MFHHVSMEKEKRHISVSPLINDIEAEAPEPLDLLDTIRTEEVDDFESKLC